MLELKFAKEPFDSKLFVLCFLKKIWIVAVATVVGLVLVGVCNYLTKVVFGGPTQYEITTSYYVDYYADPATGQIHNYVNEATWESLIDTDWFVDRTWEHALELGLVPENCNVTRDDLAGLLSADLLTDIHIPYSMVVTQSKELTEVLNDAVQLTFVDFGEQQSEMLDVRVLDETPLQEKDRDDRTLRACILGAVMGAFFGCVGVALWVIADDSVWVPETFSYRYGVPALGVLCKGKKSLSEEALVNVRYRFRGKKNVAVIAVKPEDVIPEFALPEGFENVKTERTEARYEALRQADGVLLLVEAGMRNSKEIEHCLHELAVQEIDVQGVLLYNGDAKLLKTYRMGRKQK